ncbi:MAG: YdcF family protein [Alphaproteobacteria bacterium]|nr:YdcF family protein [Alphaproteobacteria bacterium]
MKKTVCYLIICLCIFWAAGFILFNRTINTYQTDNRTKTDAIIALTGGRNRISAAVKLLNEEMAPRLLISGVQKDIPRKDIEKLNAVKLTGKPEIEIEDKSQNTVENAIEATDWIKRNNIRSIRLVTSNYHLPRSVQEFRALNKNLKIIIHPVYSEKVSAKWWKNFGSFLLVASEYNKFLFVYVKTNLLSGM